MAKAPRNQMSVLQGEWAPFEEEIKNSPPRVKAVACGAFIENALALALLTRFRDVTEKEQKSLFDDEFAALGTFAAKIDIAWSLWVFGSEARSDLHSIRKIRNSFAHSISVRDFDHPDVRSYCDNLHGLKYIPGDAKEKVVNWPRESKFMWVSRHLVSGLVMRMLLDTGPKPTSKEVGYLFNPPH